MKTTYLIIGVIVVILIVGILAFFLLGNRKSVTPPAGGSVTFPSATSTSSGQSGNSASGNTISIASRGASNTVKVNDFIHNGVTQPDPSNSGDYFLNTDYSEFAIRYNSATQFFTIALDEEPIGQNRRDAEQFLMKSLGLNEDQMCNLNYYLGTDEATNDQFAGKNLGFSFCPGATQLP